MFLVFQTIPQYVYCLIPKLFNLLLYTLYLLLDELYEPATI